ncbi:endopeptidase La [Candidatus Roizmanbacteria bacterium RIFCSPLOWO2_01_FULL_37_13]|uniref:Lon protease n=1 Tax=Candidatus Roizmanbacteria bacterium RIFCSPHIGHO2_02_FULL_38_11 TaxID=1802039 RepID=A0A1F7H4I5_9BACT|nr:MAG: endopeptidase La [Candidatus Roizmanbacteria bacterium RIFCSPHIGHO2_02_FULL_38_11]OGK42331.1 MAG: endopeptidase La [Candidatus Roizmanbacteria bacterium RIFCSPLOWO2_01_FULL_37_13]
MTILSSQSEQSVYPIVAVRDAIVFPGTENVLVFGRPKSLTGIEEGIKRGNRVVLVMQKSSSIDDPKKEDLYNTAVLAIIEKTVPGEKGEMNVLVKGQEKVKIIQYTKEIPYLEARVSKLEDKVTTDEEAQAMAKYLVSQVKRAINLGKTVDLVFLMNILNIKDPQDFSYQIAVVLDIKTEERQKLLEETDLKLRLRQEVDYINREIKILEIEKNISSKTQQKFEQGMRESFLREKMKTIEEELGGKGEDRDIMEYREKIRKAKMPKNVEEKTLKELKRLSQMSQFNPEASYIRTYLDWLVELPWSVESANNVDIKLAEKILNEDHYGLKKIKERILEYLAVMELSKRKEVKQQSQKKEHQPTILCFVGPPGVGKTSLGRSIARALSRKFIKISLGGIRDEAEIRGHRRTYVGSMPGRMIQGIKQSGTKNPVFMLDEIDKVGRDYRGDPSAALLEALDPEQNHSFSDHYLEVSFDLSDVFFITTANILDTIPDALLDRLEVIHFPGYTEDEKFSIAKGHLIKKQLDAHSLSQEETKITDNALRNIIRRYTREAGVRELERQIAAIFRKVGREIVEKKVETKTVGITDVSKYLGPYKYSSQMIEEKDTVGISTGLAWTQAGGDVLFIEVAVMPGKGGLTLTGHLGEVMKESCQAALSYIRARWDLFGLTKEFFQKIDIHVHVPEGAVPKDGPSAGTAITTAMVSALARIPVRRNVGMTGEITLRGRVLEIGGVKEKVIAAHRANIKTVIMPKDNKKDLVDIPSYVLKDLDFEFVNHMDEVLKVALAYPKNHQGFPIIPKKSFAQLHKHSHDEEKLN